jgi:hypothetical protein
MHNLTYTHTSTAPAQNWVNCSVSKKLFSEGVIGIPISSQHSSLLRQSLFHHETPTICRRVPVHHYTPQSHCLRGIYFEQAIISEISLISLHSFCVNPGLVTNKLQISYIHCLIYKANICTADINNNTISCLLLHISVELHHLHRLCVHLHLKLTRVQYITTVIQITF